MHAPGRAQGGARRVLRVAAGWSARARRTPPPPPPKPRTRVPAGVDDASLRASAEARLAAARRALARARRARATQLSDAAAQLQRARARKHDAVRALALQLLDNAHSAPAGAAAVDTDARRRQLDGSVATPRGARTLHTPAAPTLEEAVTELALLRAQGPAGGTSSDGCVRRARDAAWRRRSDATKRLRAARRALVAAMAAVDAGDDDRHRRGGGGGAALRAAADGERAQLRRRRAVALQRLRTLRAEAAAAASAVPGSLAQPVKGTVSSVHVSSRADGCRRLVERARRAAHAHVNRHQRAVQLSARARVAAEADVLARRLQRLVHHRSALARVARLREAEALDDQRRVASTLQQHHAAAARADAGAVAAGGADKGVHAPDVSVSLPLPHARQAAWRRCARRVRDEWERVGVPRPQRARVAFDAAAAAPFNARAARVVAAALARVRLRKRCAELNAHVRALRDGGDDLDVDDFDVDDGGAAGEEESGGDTRDAQRSDFVVVEAMEAALARATRQLRALQSPRGDASPLRR